MYFKINLILLIGVFLFLSLVNCRSHHTGKSKLKTESAGAKRVHASGKQPDLRYAEPETYEKCAVAADNEICSKIGEGIFKKGGNAADAVVSTHCCTEIVNSHSTGLGGGGFMVYFDKASGKSTAYDFRETLPAGYKDTQNKTQGDTILVPGVLKGLHRVWKDHGKLKWAQLWKPCIDLATEGFTIHEALNNAIVAKQQYIMANENLKLLFAPSGTLLKQGDKLKRPVLAESFRKIANSGSDEIFYTGEIAEQIVKDVREAGGKLSLSDLADYEVQVKDPLETKIRGLTMYSTPPPGSGSLISLALKIMDHFNWKPEDYDMNNPEKLGYVYHQMIEAMKFAYAPFTFLGDPRHADHIDEVIKYMLDDKVAKNMFKRVDNTSHTVNYYEPFSKLPEKKVTGTSHISIIDPKGNAIGATTSINAYFGSKLRSKALGFLYNNELADFSEFWPSVYNLTNDKRIPGKRPMSKSSPIIFVDKKGECVGVFGAAGGFFIPTALINSIANWLFFRNNIIVAISKPRIHCQLFPPTVVYEPTFPSQLIPILESYSHAYVTNSTYDVSGQLNAIMGVVQAVVRLPNGKLNANCDYRKGGKPSGN